MGALGIASNRVGRTIRLPRLLTAGRPVMADGLRRDRSRVMAAAVLRGQGKVQVQVGVLPVLSRDKVREAVLQDHLRVKVRVAEDLPDHSRDKARVAVLQDDSQVRAAVDALQDRHPVKAAGAMAAATAAEGKVAMVVGTTSNRAVVSLNL